MKCIRAEVVVEFGIIYIYIYYWFEEVVARLWLKNGVALEGITKICINFCNIIFVQIRTLGANSVF